MTMAAIEPREYIGGGRVKGGMLKAHVRWVMEHQSERDVALFWAALPKATRENVSSMILEISWYPFSDLIAIDRTIVDLFGDGDAMLARELGRYSARINLTGTYRAYRKPSAHEFLQGSARVHSSFQDFGFAEYKKTGDQTCEMRHSGYTSYSPLFCESAVGYYDAAISLHDATNVYVHETKCQCLGDGSCTFSIRWY